MRLRNIKSVQILGLSSAFISAAVSFSVSANEISAWNTPGLEYSQMDQGGIGLLQTPTARMGREGDFHLNYKDNDQYRFWSASIQLFPWLESTVRYTDIRTLLYSTDPNFSGNETAKDKGIDVKVRLLEESFYIPEVSLGLRDFGGTGFFESEFVAASKRFGNFDFNIGMGWGYLGRSGNVTNPFCKITDSYCNRGSLFGPSTNTGGKFELKEIFKGNAAIFGGVEYQTPWSPLRLKVEYEGNDYSIERADQQRLGLIVQDSKWNFGANYRYEDFDFSVSYQRGNTWTFGVSYRFNFHDAHQIKIHEEPKSLANRRKDYFDDEELNGNRVVRDLYHNAGIAINDVVVKPNKAIVYGQQKKFRDSQETMERMGRVFAQNLPDTVQEYSFVEMSNDKPMVETVIDADKFIEYATYEGFDTQLEDTISRQTPSSDVLLDMKPEQHSGFFYGVDSFWSQMFGNPEEFYLFQGGLIGSAGYNFNANLSLQGSLKATLVENFDKFNFTVDNQNSTLPRVRTYIREYVSRDRVTMDSLYMQWNDQVSENIFALAYAGYLETMYGGVGAEVLYRPVDSTVSFGFDVNWVKQRSFEDDFSFRDYDTLTGHANIYWTPQFLPDTQLTFKLGQFLAKDKGVNIDFAKRFDSGIVVGAYAAFTNVSAEEYGEGSFTKGFYISIPFDLFSLSPSRGRGKIPWIPIARDGGQPLKRPMNLNDITDVRSPFYDR